MFTNDFNDELERKLFMAMKKQHLKAKRCLIIIKKPLTLVFLFFAFLLSIYAPVYFAQLYESSIYSTNLAGMTKIEAAHYAQMISFGYQVAAISTVLIGYLMIKVIIKAIKKPSPVKVFDKKYPDVKNTK